jgi:hypothetical protein
MNHEAEVVRRASPGPGRRGQWLTLGLLVALTAAIGVVHVARLRPGHPWGDDFAMYIMHARNIVLGIPYAQTGYIYDPHSPMVGPRAYPPICPLLLAPVYARWGLDFVALKGVSVGCFLVFLLGLGWGFRRTLAPPALLALVALLGFNHFFLRDTNAVNSDEPLLAFLYLGLFLVGHAREAVGFWPRLATALVLGVAAYLAYGARTVGFLLVPAMLLEDLIHIRRPRLTTLLAVAVFALLAYAQGRWLHHDRDYFEAYAASRNELLHHAAWYAKRLAAFWSNSYCQPAAVALAAGVTLLAVAGYCQRLREKITVYEIFAVLYLVTVLLWPGYGGERLLLPIVPLWLCYALVGLRSRWLAAHGRLRGLLIAGLLAAVSATYAGRWSKADQWTAADGIGQRNAAALFGFIAGHTQPSDVMVFIKPRAMALLTGRRTSPYHEPAEDRQLWDYFHSIDARYVVTVERDRVLGSAAPPELLEYLRRFVARNRGRFEEVYRNDDFAVYRVRGEGKG